MSANVVQLADYKLVLPVYWLFNDLRSLQVLHLLMRVHLVSHCCRQSTMRGRPALHISARLERGAFKVAGLKQGV